MSGFYMWMQNKVKHFIMCKISKITYKLHISKKKSPLEKLSNGV